MIDMTRSLPPATTYFSPRRRGPRPAPLSVFRQFHVLPAWGRAGTGSRNHRVPLPRRPCLPKAGPAAGSLEGEIRL